MRGGLYSEPSESVPQPEALGAQDRWAVWRAAALGRILAWSSRQALGTGADQVDGGASLQRLLAHAVEHSPDPEHVTRATFGSFLGIAPGTFYKLLSGALRPRLELFLDLSMQLGVDPVRVLSGEYRAGERSWPPGDGTVPLVGADPWSLGLAAREARGEERYPERAFALDAFIADPRATDLTALVRSVRTSERALATEFPVRIRRARECRLERLASRREAEAARYAAVIRAEIDSGAVRNVGEVADSLGVSGATLLAYCPQEYAEWVELRPQGTHRRTPEFNARAVAALDEALMQPGGHTASSLSLALGTNEATLEAVDPEKYRALVELRAREREERRLHWAQVLRDELARERPRRVSVLAKSLGVETSTLKNADSELYEKLAGLPAARAEAKRRQRLARIAFSNTRKTALHAAVERELASADPRSVRAVAAENGVSASLVAHFWPERYRKLTAHRRARRKAYLDELCDGLEREAAGAEPRSVEAFAKAHRVGVRTLEKHRSGAVAKLREAHWRFVAS